MSVHFKEGRYFIAIIYCEVDVGRKGNLFGAMYRDEPNRELHFLYRHRWYVDDRLDDQSKDEKKWMHMKGTPEVWMTEDHFEKVMLEKLKSFLAIICGTGAAFDPDIIELRTSDVNVVMKELVKRKWAHLSSPSLFAGPERRGVA